MPPHFVSVNLSIMPSMWTTIHQNVSLLTVGLHTPIQLPGPVKANVNVLQGRTLDFNWIRRSFVSFELQ